MSEQLHSEQLGRALWRRHSAYTISAGMIRPAPGARLETYDPWEADRTAAKDEERPHRALLRLAQQLRPYRRARELPMRERKLLLRWLRRNGLLGILPHEMIQFTTAAIWHEWPLPEMRQEGEPATGMRPLQRQVTRTGTGFSTRFQYRGAERALETARLGQPVAEEDLEGVGYRVETCSLTWPKGEFICEPLGRRFQRFFPASGAREAQRRDYVPSVREAFWEQYGEPLGHFIDTAYELAAPLAGLENWSPDGGFGDRNALRALAQINKAAAVVSPVAGLMADGGKALAWSSPSLLGMFAVMMLEDITGGQRVMHCPVCGGVFLSAAHQAKFCSSTCRATHHKREWRKTQASTAGAEGNASEKANS